MYEMFLGDRLSMMTYGSTSEDGGMKELKAGLQCVQNIYTPSSKQLMEFVAQ